MLRKGTILYDKAIVERERERERQRKEMEGELMEVIVGREKNSQNRVQLISGYIRTTTAEKNHTTLIKRA